MVMSPKFGVQIRQFLGHPPSELQRLGFSSFALQVLEAIGQASERGASHTPPLLGVSELSTSVFFGHLERGARGDRE